MENLRVPGYPRPYYLSYLLRDIQSTEIWGRLGNINYQSSQASRNLYCDCRVGSYRYDQVMEGGLADNDAEQDSYEHVEMPIGNDVDALKYHVWRLTDSRYREAVRDFLRKKSRHITYLDPNRHLSSFRRAGPLTDLRYSPPPPVVVDDWRDFVERASRVVKRHPEVKSSWVEVRIRDVTRLFVNSEGTRLLDQTRVCELSCDLWLLTPAGEGISARVSHVTPAASDLPDLRTFQAQIRERIRLIKGLGAAPSLKSYAGPVLLLPQPAGILMHEVLGHRLEGSRLLATREGQTFKRDLGKQILPPFLSVVDDPTDAESNGVRAVGSYRYDDEGSPASRAHLVRRGKLVGFLGGRAPVVRGRRRGGNGHARNEYHERPISRMAHLTVSAEGGVPEEQLKQAFLEEIRRQGLPFGIMVREAEGGETATDAYNFQAFGGTIAVALQVHADGSENLVRNVNFVGTPLSALRTIMAAGDTPVTFNAFCGAESGMIPVTTTCPALLLSNLELQANDQRKYAQYVLPMPFEKAALRRRDKGRGGPSSGQANT
jgi:predicted Zn-dependent protease